MDLNFLDYGDGPPVVILHGLFGQARNWAGVAKGLGADYRVISVDLPNHGRSPWSDDVSYSAIAGHVAAFMDAHGVAGAPVVGHSMGGKVAMTLALENAGMIGGLVVVDIAPVVYDHGIQHHMEAMQALDLTVIDSREAADAAMAPAVTDAAVRNLLLSNLARGGDGNYAWRINLQALHHGVDIIHGFPDHDGTSYSGPTLFIAGETSDFIEDAHQPTMADLFPGAETIIVPGAGHWVHAEKPAETEAVLRKFLKLCS